MKIIPTMINDNNRSYTSGNTNEDLSKITQVSEDRNNFIGKVTDDSREKDNNRSNTSDNTNEDLSKITQVAEDRNNFIGKITDDWKVIPANLFPTHNQVGEAHLTKVYGVDVHKKNVQQKKEMIQNLKDLKLQVVTMAKNIIKTRMVDVATKQGLKYYSHNKVEHFVRVYRDIKKSFATDISRKNLEKIFHVCYGNFDVDTEWIYSMEREIMFKNKLKYKEEDEIITYKPKTGRPPKSSLIQCINIAKNDLVKGIIYHGSKIHGFEIRIKHTKNRLPGIFSDDFLVRKCNIDYKNKDVIIVDDDDKLKQNFHTDEVSHTVNICNLVKSPSKNKFIETVSNLRKILLIWSVKIKN